MAIAEVEKRIHQLEPQYLDALAEYVEYLLFLQKKRVHDRKRPDYAAITGKQTGVQEIAESEIPERLKTLRKFRGIAPKPHFPVTKYDVYEQ